MRTNRIWTLLFPPLGLVRLWRAKDIRLWRRILGTIGILFYLIPYTIAVGALVIWLLGLEIEWRGGFPPALTWHKTHPNYDAVEASRKAQATTAAALPPPAGEAEWPGFRGPDCDGRWDRQPIASHWPAGGLRPLWKQPIGGGYASFAIAGQRAFTIEQRRDNEAVTAYDLRNGRELWATTYPAHFNEMMGGDGPRATPCFSEGKVYSLGALGDLLCLDAVNGKVIWQVNILKDNQAELLRWGTSSSPLIVNDKVIVQPGGPDGKSVVAYDKLSGKPIWRVLDDAAAYSSPVLTQLAGEEQLLVVTERRAAGLRPGDGALLWSTPWLVMQGRMAPHNMAQPLLLASNRFLLSSSYGKGCEAVEISRAPAGFSARTLWKNMALKNHFTSSILWRGYVYGLDEDILVCLDAQTGERKWKDGRYGYGQIIASGDLIIVLCGDGQLALVKAAPDRFQEWSRFQAIDGKTWNHPAIAGGKLLVRNAVQMACFDLSP
jgi:outer membrane protein assembly factor BamB